MKRFNYEKVESAIGYHFNNGKLLKQAFFRSSFAHENGRESNEVLEFIGDKVLDLAVIRILLEKYSKLDNEKAYFKSSKQEGELTQIKSNLVSTHYLAKCFNKLDIDEFIYFGKNDLNNNVIDVASVKEDVFESIIGAIALDSNWNMKIIIGIVKRLLHFDLFFKIFDDDTNYVGIVQEMASKLCLSEPVYVLSQTDIYGTQMWRALLKINGIQSVDGFGSNQKEARKEAAKQMIPYLKAYERDSKAKKAIVNREEIFAAINSYVQSGIINKPKCSFNESFDDNGNPYWECSTSIEGSSRLFFGYGSTKKEAQQHSFAKLLKELI